MTKSDLTLVPFPSTAPAIEAQEQPEAFSEPVICSKELSEITGKLHAHVLRDIREVLEDVKEDYTVLTRVRRGLFPELDKRGYTAYYRMNRYVAGLLITGYSTTHRARVLARLEELEAKEAANDASVAPAIPQTLSEALRLAADMAEQNEALEQERDEALRTKALIGSKREASAMAKASVAIRRVRALENELGRGEQLATVAAVEQAIKRPLHPRAQLPLERWSKESGVRPKPVPCPVSGKIIPAWPAKAWKDCFKVELKTLFKKSA